MSTTLTAGPDRVSISWDFEDVKSPRNTVDASEFSYNGTQLTNGTAAGNADLHYKVGGQVIAASGSLTLNLSSLTSPFGATMNFARVKRIYIALPADVEDQASSILIGGAGTTPFGNWITSAGTFATDQPAVRLRAGMVFFLGTCPDGTGYAVGSGVSFKITNEDSVNDAAVDISILGCSA